MGLRMACAAFYPKTKSNGLPGTRSLEFLVWVFCSHLLGRFISMNGPLLPCWGMKQANKLLLFGGLLSGVAALLHLAIIVGGPQWYRF